MPPHRRSDGEREELLRELQGAGNKLTREQGDIDHAISRANSLATLVKWLVGGIVAVVLFAAKLQWTVADQGEKLKLNTASIESNRAVLQALQETVRSNRSERQGEMAVINGDLARVKDWIKEWTQPITEMDFMRRKGISNKEDFQQKNGLPSSQ